MTGNEYKLLSYIQMNGGICFNGSWSEYVGTVSRRTYMSYRTVQRTIESLMNKGLIYKDCKGYHIEV